MRKIRFRQSFLKRWCACPLQGYLAEVEHQPTRVGSKQTFGSCMHAALEQYNRTGDIEGAKKLFMEAWDEPRSIGLPDIEVWNKFTAFGDLRKKGLDVLRAYDQRMRMEQRTVVAIEHPFLVPFGHHELTGTVDLVEVRKNHRGKQLLLINDYKTNTRAPSVAELALNLQFTTYIFATLQREFWLGNGPDFPGLPNGEWYWETLRDMPRRGMWIHLWHDGKELDAGGRDDDDFGRLYRLCCEIERAIELKVFVPNIGDACTLCDFSSGACPVVVPDRSWWEKERIHTDEESWA